MISHQLHQSDLHSRGQDYTALKYSGVGILGMTLEFFFWQPRSSLWISMSWSLKNPRGKKSGWLSSHLFTKFIWPQWKLYFHITPSLSLKLVLCFIYVLGYTETGKKKKNWTTVSPGFKFPSCHFPVCLQLGLVPWTHSDLLKWLQKSGAPAFEGWRHVGSFCILLNYENNKNMKTSGLLSKLNRLKLMEMSKRCQVLLLLSTKLIWKAFIHTV